MQSVNILRDSNVVRTPRVIQLEGIFDFPPSERSVETWEVNMPLPDDWNVGVIVGPSGSGKTTIAREIFKNAVITSWSWDDKKSILDSFPEFMSIKDIVKLLSSVGFSSPPSWVRSYRVLSTGEQFRVNIARTLSEKPDLAVVDEFTSVVDRTVAQIGSSAIQKAVRKRNQRFVAVTCHYDILDWLEPDWVYQPHTNEFYNGRYLHQRPKINIKVKQVHYSAWRMFRKHHYLDTSINKAAVCFVGFWEDVPVVFSSYLHFPHPKAKRVKREHRTVCLPDYQGVGIGNALSNYVASFCRVLRFRYLSQTSNPAMIQYRNKSKLWKMIRKPKRILSAHSRTSACRSWRVQTKRVTASFEYIGSVLDSK